MSQYLYIQSQETWLQNMLWLVLSEYFLTQVYQYFQAPQFKIFLINTKLPCLLNQYFEIGSLSSTIAMIGSFTKFLYAKRCSPFSSHPLPILSAEFEHWKGPHDPPHNFGIFILLVCPTGVFTQTWFSWFDLYRNASLSFCPEFGTDILWLFHWKLSRV